MPSASSLFAVNSCTQRRHPLMVTISVGPDKFDVWVECDGKRLEEWAPKHHEHQQECWIASEEGKVRPLAFRDAISMRISFCIEFRSLCGVFFRRGAKLLCEASY